MTRAGLEPGQRIGNFEVVRPLGEGGLAQVFLLRHPELQSLHALKVLQVNQPKMLERLRIEGRIQATLKHPHVVAVSDVLQVGDGIGLVMEFVDGITLGALLDKGPVPMPEALRLFGQILDAVGAAHRMGVLHRDLKPANVLLATLGNGRYFAKVADFGIAKTTLGQGDKLTRTGSMMGSPGYMAPEQIDDAGHADPRADIFALGVILYEMISGESPFIRGQLLDTLTATMRGDCAPLVSLVPSCPPAFAAAVHKAIQPDPKKRFESCEAFAEALGGAPTTTPATIARPAKTGGAVTPNPTAVADDLDEAPPVATNVPSATIASAPVGAPPMTSVSEGKAAARPEWLAAPADPATFRKYERFGMTETRRSALPPRARVDDKPSGVDWPRRVVFGASVLMAVAIGGLLQWAHASTEALQQAEARVSESAAHLAQTAPTVRGLADGLAALGGNPAEWQEAVAHLDPKSPTSVGTAIHALEVSSSQMPELASKTGAPAWLRSLEEAKSGVTAWSDSKSQLDLARHSTGIAVASRLGLVDVSEPAQ